MPFSAWCGVLILVLAVAYIPLSIWGATGSWRRGWEALRQYGIVMGAICLVGVLWAGVGWLGMF